ncbi:MAG TPA: MBL fold metallo-hydrolase [Terriglobales bacterium]|nr:MBL fold metallo-hydrolase [Terriglobales bacterium]
MSRYSILLLEYASQPNVPVGDILYGKVNEPRRRMPYCYVLLRSHDHIALVDIGYNHADFGGALAESYGVDRWHDPAEVLALCGLRPADIDSIFITHAHFDHFGNIEAFPKAHFYIAAEEIERSVWALGLPERLNFMAMAIDPGDLVKAARLTREGRLTLIDQDRTDVIPGIDLHIARDTHTFASIWVEVRNDGKNPSEDNWVIAGDLVYSYDNIGGTGDGITTGTPYHPIGIAIGSQMNLLLTTEAMLQSVGCRRKRIVPVHEERVMQLFPSRQVKPGLSITEICTAADAVSLLA